MPPSAIVWLHSYVWQFEHYAAREQLPAAVQLLLGPIVKLLRRWDYDAAQRDNLHFIAISREIQQRIKQFYGRSSTIIHPGRCRSVCSPFPTHRGTSAVTTTWWSLRLVPYKRIDLAVRAFTRLGLPLLIAGEGRDRPALKPSRVPQFASWVACLRRRWARSWWAVGLSCFRDMRTSASRLLRRRLRAVL